MKFTPTRFIMVDKNGDLRFPAELRETQHLTTEAMVRVGLGDVDENIPPLCDCLSRVYIEPTNRCNLECLTCIRNVWDEPLGMMRWEVYERILEGIQGFTPMPSVFLGGFGEPFIHPQLFEMIRKVKDLGGWVEVITNGILLTEDACERLIGLGLDVLWISIDGVTAESYADVRLGATLPRVLANLDRLIRMRDQAVKSKPQVGLAYVAMKKNIHELPELIGMGVEKGIEQFSISNVLAYTPELQEEVLYERSLITGSLQPVINETNTVFPGMGRSTQTLEPYLKALQSEYPFQLAGGIANHSNQCPFILKESTSIRWDGEISPCLPLLHTHDSYLGKRLRRSQAYSFGNIENHSLQELWNNPGYVALRERLRVFDFSPCTFCNSCEMADGNLEDCFGNNAPACGGCLWAQGLIQCP